MTNDQWMPGKDVKFTEQRVERLERMVAHLFRALHETQESNKAKIAELKRELRAQVARLDPHSPFTWNASEMTQYAVTLPYTPPESRESDEQGSDGTETPDEAEWRSQGFVQIMSDGELCWVHWDDLPETSRMRFRQQTPWGPPKGQPAENAVCPTCPILDEVITYDEAIERIREQNRAQRGFA